MRIIVCIKQVPSSNEVRLDPITNTIIRDGFQSVINPFDFYALEEAARRKEQLGGEVVVLSMGIPATERLLRDATSRGADRALLLCDPRFAGSDTLATSYALSLGVHYLGGFDLILCGKMAVDGDTAQIGPELAETLRIPHISDVCELLEVSEKEITCKKVTDTGYAVLRIRLPALLTVVKDINMPRLPSIASIRLGLNARIEVLDADCLKADHDRIGLNGSPTQVVKTFVPQRSAETVRIIGDARSQAITVADLIKEGKE